MRPFRVVVLVDADGVDPETNGLLVASYAPQRRGEILGDLEGFAVEVDGFLGWSDIVPVQSPGMLVEHWQGRERRALLDGFVPVVREGVVYRDV